MYKSSKITFVYKYLFTPLWGGIFLFVIMSYWNQEDQFLQDWSRGAALMVGWALIWLTILMIRLRNIEANETQIIVKSFNSERTINYKDIEYVSQLAMINPSLISIKYRNSLSGEANKILVMPSTTQMAFKPKPLGENDMTKFLRDQIVQRNANYSTELEPSRWKAFWLLILTGIPAGIYTVIVVFMNFEKLLNS